MGDSIKVLILCDYNPCVSRVDGGVQAVSRYLIEGLRQRGDIELFVVTFDTSLHYSKTVHLDNLTVIILPRAARFNNILFYRRDRRVFQRCLRDVRPDIVHAQDGSVEGYIAAKSGVKTVITFHGMIAEDAKYMTALRDRLRLRFISCVAERYCVKSSADKIIISSYVANYYGHRLNGRCTYIPNPVARSFFELQKREVPGRILCAGKIIPRKGIVDLIATVGALDKSLNFEVVLAGAMEDDSYSRELQVTIDRLGVRGRVKFLGLLDESMILEEFSTASILVLTSYQETAPMVIQQAMASGVAVVATAICGIPEQLDYGKCGLLFEPGDSGACAQHIETLLTKPVLKRRLESEARQKAFREYQVERVVKQTYSVYASMFAASEGAA